MVTGARAARPGHRDGADRSRDGLFVARAEPGLVGSRLGVFERCRCCLAQWGTALGVFRRGIRLARRDPEIRLVLVATLVQSGALMVAGLFPKQLINLGFPNDLILWYTAIGILSAALGVVALAMVERRIDGVGMARRYYALARFIGFLNGR